MKHAFFILLGVIQLAQASDFQDRVQTFHSTCLAVKKTNAQVIVSEENTPMGLHMVCEFDALPQELTMSDKAFDSIKQSCVRLDGEFMVLQTRGMASNPNLPAYLKLSCYLPYWE